MNKIIVTNQQELDIAISESVCVEILLDGERFTLPSSNKIHDLTFIGVNPQTRVFLTGTFTKSKKYDPRENKVPGHKPQMVNQFDTVFSTKCQNLMVTAEAEIELYFQTKEELEQWRNITIDYNKFDVVIFEDEINSFESKEREFEIDEVIREVGEMTVELLEDIQDSFTDLIKCFK